MKHIGRLLIFLVLYAISINKAYAWGIYSHKKINYCAVYTLHDDVLDFYKQRKNFKYFVQKAGVPDNRKYMPGYEHEKVYHYIDLDYYRLSTLYDWKTAWKEATENYNEDHGIVPWVIYKTKEKLVQAFKNCDKEGILKLSVDIAHYIADSTVPLHTTSNYDGQLTNQQGIHALWETRLPELFSKKYDLFVGPAKYIDNPIETIWNNILETHKLAQVALDIDKQLSQQFIFGRYVYEKRGESSINRTHTKEYARRYHEMLNGQVEAQMRKAIKLIGDFIYTCWIDAGQPSLPR